jgi:hypothetical protein
MRNSSAAIAGLVLSATVLSGFSISPSTMLTTTRTVTGRVMDGGNMTGLSSVDVVASGHQIGAQTQSTGEFRLDNVPEGATRIALRHPCYFNVQVTIPTTGDVDMEIGLPFDRASLQRVGCGGLGARKR